MDKLELAERCEAEGARCARKALDALRSNVRADIDRTCALEWLSIAAALRAQRGE